MWTIFSSNLSQRLLFNNKFVFISYYYKLFSTLVKMITPGSKAKRRPSSQASSMIRVCVCVFECVCVCVCVCVFWLHWVFIVARGLSLVVASGGYSSLWCTGFSLRWLLLLQSMGSRRVGFSSCSTQAQ